MKKWGIAALVVFFAVFILLFSSVEQPRKPKITKICEWEIIDDVYVQIAVSPVIADSFLEYEAGAGWKFVILEFFISNQASATRSFHAGRIEDEDGMVYLYHLEDPPYGPEGVSLRPGTRRCISIAYKMPANAVPEKIHFSIYNSGVWDGEIILKK